VKRSLELSKMNVRVGVMAAIAFVILVWVLFFPVRGVSPFAKRIRVTGYFERVDGLRRSAPVYFRGTEVGTVASVTVEPEHPEAPLMVVIEVEKHILPLLPKDVRMDIVAEGLLGDVVIDLKTPTLRRGDAPMLADGDVLATDPYSSMMSGMAGLADELKTLVENVNSVMNQVRSGQGTVGKLVNDDQLYRELVAAVRQLKDTAARVDEIEKTINTKLLDANTKKAVDQTVASAQRLIDNTNRMTEKAQAIRWHLSLGLDKYAGELYGASAALRIIPNDDRYYQVGISYFNQNLDFTANDDSLGSGYVGYDVALAWRIPTTPLFFRAGVKRSSPDAGLDFRVGDVVHWLPVELNADAYHFGNAVTQFDLGATYAFAKAFELTAGVEDIAVAPRFRVGLVLLYDDQDLTSVLVKAKTGL
jgi:phospholipid/cholesterol/gamma-HCH transport system substrate-binding protein